MKTNRRAPRETEYLQALIVLNATDDGETLEPEDLKLVEDVVTFGTSGLSIPRRARWQEVVSLCERNQYTSAFQTLGREPSRQQRETSEARR